jgi:hypothetical protein
MARRRGRQQERALKTLIYGKMNPNPAAELQLESLNLARRGLFLSLRR